ncbi:MAG: flavodoxin family protein [Lentisphaeria bacterium]|nr:flavodoxin family protein [Lentisphaeria bacterium]
MGSSKKIYAVNGSPRRCGNTAELLNSALAGAADGGAETEFIQLSELRYSGCISCFCCKRKNSPFYGKCAVMDDLTAVLEKLQTADGVILGTPVYFGSESGIFRNLIERLFFANFRYDQNHSSLLKKQIPLAFIYTMNVNTADAAKYRYADRLHMLQAFGGRIFNFAEPPVLFACNTWQFDDYDKYDAELFDVADKKRSRAEEFPVYRQQAYQIGRDFAGM